jgi:hypothetical protein
MFTYNRPEHTKRTLEALLQNSLSKDSEITIYSDAPKTDEDSRGVREVRDYLKTVSGFKSIQIIKQSENQGLSKSIINGVTRSVREHGKSIVLEDDMLTSPYFLKYMNAALEFYENEKKVMHVAGWGYPIPDDGLDDGFLWRGMNCWGWATWEDRWAFFQKDIPALYRQVPLHRRYHFNLNGRRRYWRKSQPTNQVCSIRGLYSGMQPFICDPDCVQTLSRAWCKISAWMEQVSIASVELITWREVLAKNLNLYSSPTSGRTRLR